MYKCHGAHLCMCVPCCVTSRGWPDDPLSIVQIPPQRVTKCVHACGATMVLLCKVVNSAATDSTSIATSTVMSLTSRTNLAMCSGCVLHARWGVAVPTESLTRSCGCVAASSMGNRSQPQALQVLHLRERPAPAVDWFVCHLLARTPLWPTPWPACCVPLTL